MAAATSDLSPDLLVGAGPVEDAVLSTQRSSTVAELVSSETITRKAPLQGQEETASLTDAGRQTFAETNAYAQDHVTKALAPATTPGAAPAPPTPSAVAIVPGYRPHILVRTLEMHLDYYHPRFGWDRGIEAGLSQRLGNLLERLDKPINQVWSAVVTSPARDSQAPGVGRIVGVVYVDGECSGEEGVARLRAFIVDDLVRGLGVGKKLFAAAMDFVQETGFRECHLSTLRELTVARRIYENAGFKEAGEDWFEGFGNGFMQMTYVWRRPDEPEKQ